MYADIITLNVENTMWIHASWILTQQKWLKNRVSGPPEAKAGGSQDPLGLLGKFKASLGYLVTLSQKSKTNNPKSCQVFV